MRKFEKLIIIVLVIAIIGLVYGLIPTKIVRELKRNRRKLKSRKIMNVLY